MWEREGERRESVHGEEWGRRMGEKRKGGEERVVFLKMASLHLPNFNINGCTIWLIMMPLGH